jgi:hypothetical protein
LLFSVIAPVALQFTVSLISPTLELLGADLILAACESAIVQNLRRLQPR